MIKASESKANKIILDGQELVKRLGILPPNKLTPKLFALEARKVAKKNKLKITALSEVQMRKLGMGGILAVSQGSAEEAQGIILGYSPRGAKKTIAITGKSVTFDSGGISIKPARGLHEMKYDMLGGATALAVIEAASKLKLPIRIVCMIAASENMPGGRAVRPGDVITAYNGKTIEVVNTDAEGRLLLADCLSYLSSKYRPDMLIDIATLTHAITVSLGNKITGAFGTNDAYNRQLVDSGKRASEPIHFLPLFADYLTELKSPVADLANVSKQRFDAVIGALFLKEFVNPKTPWIHLDIGGTAYTKDGPTGVMVSTLVEFLRRQ